MTAPAPRSSLATVLPKTPHGLANLHALVVGIANGVLSYLAGILAGGHLPAWRVLAVGAATAGASRIVGFLIALLNAPSTP